MVGRINLHNKHHVDALSIIPVAGQFIGLGTIVKGVFNALRHTFSWGKDTVNHQKLKKYLNDVDDDTDAGEFIDDESSIRKDEKKIISNKEKVVDDIKEIGRGILRFTSLGAVGLVGYHIYYQKHGNALVFLDDDE